MRSRTKTSPATQDDQLWGGVQKAVNGMGSRKAASRVSEAQKRCIEDTHTSATETRHTIKLCLVQVFVELMVYDLGPPTCGTSSESGFRAAVPRPGFGALKYTADLDADWNQSCIKAPKCSYHLHTNSYFGLSLAASTVIILTSGASALATTSRTTVFPLQLRPRTGSRNLMSKKRSPDRMVRLSAVNC